MATDKHPITCVERASRFELECVLCQPGTCFARFPRNVTATAKHFSPHACQGFKERILDIFGCDGDRRLVPKGTPGWLPHDGKLGSRPDNHPPEE